MRLDGTFLRETRRLFLLAVRTKLVHLRANTSKRSFEHTFVQFDAFGVDPFQKIVGLQVELQSLSVDASEVRQQLHSHNANTQRTIQRTLTTVIAFISGQKLCGNAYSY